MYAYIDLNIISAINTFRNKSAYFIITVKCYFDSMFMFDNSQIPVPSCPPIPNSKPKFHHDFLKLPKREFICVLSGWQSRPGKSIMMGIDS